MLTSRQLDLLNFLHSHIEETGLAPSFDEMKDALGLHSKSGVHRLVVALEERGFIRRLPDRARALEVIRVPGTPTTTELLSALKDVVEIAARNETGEAVERARAVIAKAEGLA